MAKIIIDGENALLGRLASYTAKQSLQGKEIIILNSEKIIISGNKQKILKDFLEKKARGGSSQKGPYISAVAYMIVKRTIRGMLPKNARGREALKRIKCYNDIPKEFENEKKIKAKIKDLEHINLGELSQLIKQK